MAAKNLGERIVDVLVPLAVDRPYSYKASETLEPGDIVVVPLGNREESGVVWPGSGEKPAAVKLKSVIGKADAPRLPLELVKLIDWIADYTLAPRGMVLRMALRRSAELGAAREKVGVRITGVTPERMTEARARVLSLLENGLLRSKSETAEEAGVSPSVIDGLIDQGALETEALPPEPIALPPDAEFAVPQLNPAQTSAAKELREAVRAKKFSVSLLDGVTGSGKTEVYFEAVAEVLKQKRQALILLPEIALTTRFLDRFAERFGVRPAEWHSAIAPRKRARIWEGVARGEISVVAGARSALFLPFNDLALIVLDEEHDPAYKQEDGVHYHARDMAVVRGSLAQAAVVLTSATPSIETENNARRGRYKRLQLSERYSGTEVPQLAAIDLKKEGPHKGRWISPRLEQAIKETAARGEQALLFLNRRGYAPLTLCRSCGFRMRCVNCDTWLVEHRYRKRLVCHHCGFDMPPPQHCPKCETADSFVAVGPGVERLEEEVRAMFPEARTLVLSSDMSGGVERLRAELEAVTNRDVDIVIGTQLVAKGHHFPGLALVGIIDADLGLNYGDPRAAERTFQLLHQVVGRAGRENIGGRGLLQTYQPDHPVMKALLAGDRDAFYDSEIQSREEAGLPPFGRMVAIIVSAKEGSTAESYARKLAANAPLSDDVRLLGPAEAPLSMIRGRHRWRLLVTSPRNFELSNYVREWLESAPPAKGSLRVQVDVDPQSFL